MKTKHVIKSHEAPDLQRLEPSPAASAPHGAARGPGPSHSSVINWVPSHLRGQGALTYRESPPTEGQCSTNRASPGSAVWWGREMTESQPQFRGDVWEQGLPPPSGCPRQPQLRPNSLHRAPG